MRPCQPPKPSPSHLPGPSALPLGCGDLCYCLSQLQDPEPPRDRPSLVGHWCGPSSLPCVCCVCTRVYTCVYMYVNIYFSGFPGSSVGKESTCSPGDPGSIPGSGRSPGEGNGKPLQCSCHGQRSLAGYSPWGCKSQTWQLNHQIILSMSFTCFPPPAI